jgi:hypothetical protein
MKWLFAQRARSITGNFPILGSEYGGQRLWLSLLTEMFPLEIGRRSFFFPLRLAFVVAKRHGAPILDRDAPVMKFREVKLNLAGRKIWPVANCRRVNFALTRNKTRETFTA